MSDKGWDTDDEAGGAASFHPPVDNGADAWGAPELHVPAIPVDDASAPVVTQPVVSAAPPAGAADPVWAVPVHEPEPETDPVWAIRSRLVEPEPEPAREPDPVWAVPSQPAEPAWAAPGAPVEPSWAAPASPEPTWAAPVTPEPAREPDPVWGVPAQTAEPAWAAPAEPDWGAPAAAAPVVARDPWGNPTSQAPGAATEPTPDPWGIGAAAAATTVAAGATTPGEAPGSAAPGPLSDRLAHAAQPATTPGAQDPSYSNVSTGTGSTPAAAAAGWPTATPAEADRQAVTAPQDTSGRPWPESTVPPAAGSAAAYGAGYAAAGPAAGTPPAAGTAAGWPAGTDPRAAAWPQESRSPYAPPPSGYPQAGYGQGQPGYGQASGWPQGTYSQGQAGYQGQGAYPPGAYAQPNRTGYGQPAAGQWNQQGQWIADPQPPTSATGWAGYPNQGWSNQPTASGWDQQAPVAGAAAWGATNAAYWQAEEQADGSRRYGRSIGATLTGVILFVFGALLALAGVAVFMAGTTVDLNEALDKAGVTSVDRDAVQRIWDFSIGLAPFVAVIGVLELLAGLLVLAHKTFGRVLGLLFGLAGTILGGLLTVLLFQLPPTVQADGSTVNFSGSAIPVAVLTAIYLFVFLTLAAGGKHFRRGA